MIEFSAVFWIGVITFAVIGFLRGWIREIQVTAAAILAIFIVDKLSPFVWEALVTRTSAELLATDPMGTLRRLVVLKVVVTIICVFFGYQGPAVIEWGTSGRLSSNRVREDLQEGLIGIALGLLNGYLIIGALWWYLHVSQYPFDWMISPLNFPETASASMINILPLQFLASPWLDIAVVVAFLIVIVVLI